MQENDVTVKVGKVLKFMATDTNWTLLRFSGHTVENLFTKTDIIIFRVKKDKKTSLKMNEST